MSPAEVLSSNVVNYLIWRYLQESGYGSAAVQLSRKWHRDPQSLPFTKNIKRRTLVHILQDGLAYDNVREETTGERKYVFGADHGVPWPIVDAAERSNSIQSRPGSAKKQPNGVAYDELQQPTAKRQKRIASNGIEPRTNGDVADTETNGGLPTDDDVAVMDVDSPIVEEIPRIDTLSIGHSTEVQTEKAADLTPGTKFVRIDAPGSRLSKTEWNPFQPSILATGKSVKYVYELPDSPDTPSTEIKPREVKTSLVEQKQQYEITSTCWIDRDEAYISILEETPNPRGEPGIIGKLFRVNNSEDTNVLISSSVGAVTALRWNDSKRTLLSISTTDSGGVIRLFHYKSQKPLRTAFTKQPIYDAIWMDQDTFSVSGQGFLQIYHVPDSSDFHLLNDYDTGETSWHLVRYDPVCKILACASIDQNELCIIHSDADELKTLQLEVGNINDLYFQPIPDPSKYDLSRPRLLATSSDDTGIVTLYDAKIPFQILRTLSILFTPTSALAFSPDGLLLAAAGLDKVHIWDPEIGGVPKATWHWAGSEKEWDTKIEEDSDQELPHSLSWDSEGKKLAFSLGNQIAIINFQR